MKHIVGLACAALALGLLGSPLAAQETAVPPAPPPVADQLPPPPPFPPMPSSRPSHRHVDLSGHRTSHSHARKASAHQARPAKHHKSSTKHRARVHSSKRSVRSSAHRDKPLHLSKKTIRQCHGMTYGQIMRHSSCRALMKQELAAPAHKARTSHKASSKRGSKHHSTKRRRR